MTSLAVPVVAGVFVVLGAMIGAFLSRSNEHRQWLRNEKLKAYQEYVDRFGGAPLSTAFGIIGYDEREGPEVIAAYEEMYRICLRVVFIAPVAIAEEANKTIEALGNLQGWINELPTVMHRDYLADDPKGKEAIAANKAMTSDIYRQLQDQLADFASDSISRVSVAADLMRKDLRIRQSIFV
jgi:hypothetical protein